MADTEKQKFIEENRILEVEVGSFVYGTNIETSDKDYSGIISLPEEYYLGFNTLDEIDMSIISKLSNGKNSSDAVDKKYYNVKKFFKLAMESNPNILEQLFTPKANIIFENELGKRILDCKHLFPSKLVKQKFLGYAFSQKHKMVIKTDNYNSLSESYKWFEDKIFPEIGIKRDSNFSAKLLAEFRDAKIPGVKFNDSFATIGDMNISVHDKMSKVFFKLTERLSKVGNREELYTKYGYDTKFGMHLIRLMLEGKELLETGSINYPLIDANMLIDIRNGKWSKESIIEYSEQLESEIETLVEKTSLPTKPNYNQLEKVLISIIKDHWRQ